ARTGRWVLHPAGGASPDRPTGPRPIDGNRQYRQGIVAVNAAYQCKQWQRHVSRPDIDQFRGAIAGSYDLGVYITTSSFTKDAQEVPFKPGTITIVLVDGKAIGDLMVKYEIGLRRRVMQVGTVDDAFFESLSEDERE
ncbi:MAG: restriction endonuclease, partial [Firmicutes bacterium]|nr:restriction endonuclease [Bacillota bacterium]